MKNKKHIILILLILAVVYIINAHIYKRNSTDPHLSSFGFVFLFLALLNSKKNIFNIIGSFLSILFFLEIFYFIEFRESLSIGILDSIVETNKTESMLMLSHYIFPIILPAILTTIAVFLIFNKNKNKLPSWFNFLPIIFYTLFVVSLSSEIISNKNRLIADFKEDPHELGKYIKDKFPIVIGNISYIVNASLHNDRYHVNNIAKYFDNSIASQHSSENKLIILIIGESALPTRFSLYGYTKNTTPSLDNIFSSPDSCIIRQAHSSAPITRNSISLSLSFYTPESEENLFNKKSIIEMAQAQGYKTYWLGAQPIKGVHGSKYGFIASKSDILDIQEDNDDLLPISLKKILSDKNEKKFIIIHLWGSHKPYINYTDAEKHTLKNTDDYDLTIYHTDNVIKNIYREITAVTNDYTLIYTSDHGEIVNKGHGFKTGLDQFLVPFLYKSSNPDYNCQFIEKYRNQNGWISGLMNKYILSELLGYSLNTEIVNKEKENDRVLSIDEIPEPFSVYLNENHK
ncbi:MAG: phosphoethanolamine transferase [Morganella sp. (in: enterobacteria)]